MNMIVLEGMKGTGKSTLLDNLKKDLSDNTLTHHFDLPRGNINEQKYYFQQGQFEMMFDVLDKLDKLGCVDNIILDRSHIGEYVWGPFYRDLFPVYLPNLELEYLHLNIKVFLLVGNKDIIKQRWENSRDTEFPEHFDTVQEMFINAMDYTPFDVITIDSTILTPEEMSKKVLNSLDK